MPSQPGDILLFSGRWSDRTARAIKLGTCSRWTHVAGCVAITYADIVEANRRRESWGEELLPVGREDFDDGVYLFEATTLSPLACRIQLRQVNGVQVHWPRERIESYDGRVWRRTLKRPLLRTESFLLTLRVLDSIGAPYDYSGAGLSATWIVKRWGLLGRRKAADTRQMFCSEELLECYQFALFHRLSRRVTSGALPPRDVATWAEELYLPAEELPR